MDLDIFQQFDYNSDIHFFLTSCNVLSIKCSDRDVVSCCAVSQKKPQIEVNLSNDPTALIIFKVVTHVL